MKTLNWRFIVMGSVVALLGVATIINMMTYMAGERKQAVLDGFRQSFPEQRTLVYEPTRGMVYDRWGNLLAGNQISYEIGVNLADVTNPDAIARAVSNFVPGVDYQTALDAASVPYHPNTAVYNVLAQNASPEVVKTLEEMRDRYAEEFGGIERDEDAPPLPSLSGLMFTPKLARVYPEGDLAFSVLGFVSAEGRGYFGVEEAYNQLLTGTIQQVSRPSSPGVPSDIPANPEGASLILTIDRHIQAAVEEILVNAVEANDATSGAIIVMQPETGEILAMASTPSLDLNQYQQYDEIFPRNTPFSKITSEIYEPGSVFKVLTMAAALDSGTVTPDTIFTDTGVINVGGAPIYNWDRGAWGPQDMQGCMQHSLNVCLAWLATEMGMPTFYDYLSRFRMGQLTGIDVAGETRGLFNLPGDANWHESNLGTNSFGQGISVTPLQLVTAVSAIANDGDMMVPHIVKAVIDRGRQYEITPQLLSEPIESTTAHTLTAMLTASLESETEAALVDGYSLAGKTGTAQIPGEGGYLSDVTNASFVGWGPSDDPKFIVYVWIEKPQSSPWGSVVAAPVFKQVVERLVVLMDLPPDSVRLAMTSR